MKDHIKRVSRNDPMFQNRAIVVYGSPTDKTVIPVPDGLIVCDSCNDEIKTPKINLLVLNGSVWGAICESCRKRNFKKFPILNGVC